MNGKKLEKIIKTKSWLFEKIHKMDKSLARFTKENKRKGLKIKNDRLQRH